MSPLLLIAFCLQLFLISANAAASPRPNIILILADDYGWSDIGYHNVGLIKTPNLDSLAADGVKLESYYVQALCSPTRTSMLSGRYAVNTGLGHGVILHCQRNGLPLTMKTFPERLHDLGYATHAIGKWHAGYFQKAYAPLQRGFDSFFGFQNAYNDHYTYVDSYDPNHYDPIFGLPPPSGVGNLIGIDLHDGNDVVSIEDYLKYNGTYSSMLYTQKAEDIIIKHALENKNNDKPLFLYLPFQVNHYPMQAPESYLTPYLEWDLDEENRDRLIMAGMVATLDEAVGNITKSLKDNGLWDNTVLVFSTDNGGDYTSGGYNWPLRGGKASMYEGGLRGVGFVSSPLLSNEVRGTVNNELLHVSDWYATFVGLAGGDTSNLGIDGFNVWNTINITGTKSPRTEIMHQIDPLIDPRGVSRPGSPFNTTMQSAFRSGDWKLITGDPGYNPGYSSGVWMPPPELNLTMIKDTNPVEQNVFLYNIKDDPYEKTDLSKSNPTKVDELLEKVNAYWRNAAPMLFGLEDFQCDPALHNGYWVPWVPDTDKKAGVKPIRAGVAVAIGLPIFSMVAILWQGKQYLSL